MAEPATTEAPTDSITAATRSLILLVSRSVSDEEDRHGLLGYRVIRERGSNCYVIRDPFRAAIDGVPTLERALEMATNLAENVREWTGETIFDC
jgi:hypothetical protein